MWGSVPLGASAFRVVQVALSIVISVIFLVGLGVVYVQSGDRAVPYSSEAAVAAFRTPPTTAAPAPSEASPAASAPPSTSAPEAAAAAAPASTVVRPQVTQNPPPLPAEAALARPPAGVYVYKTEGEESTSALGGAKHTYPSETTITVRHTDCGFNTQWQPLEQRADFRSFCPDPNGLRIIELASRREFFGRTAGTYQQCAPETYYLKLENGSPAPSWSGPCTGRSGAQFTLSGSFLGAETKQIGSQSVEALKFEITVNSASDSGRASIRAIVTVASATGLFLAIDSTTDAATSGPSGSATYKEHYVLELASLDPLT